MKLLFAIAMSYLAAWGQKPGAVEGMVSDRATGVPVRKALVTLRSENGRTGYQALSDAAGRFRITGVAPGNYGLWGEAQGYSREMARFSAPSQAVAVAVAEDQTVRDLAIRLQPLGAISGRVLDASGDAVAGATVDAMRYTYEAAGPSLFRGTTVTTNDRGEFRAFDLEPGRWYLRVNKGIAYPKAAGRVHRAMPDMEYAETYYPGVGRAEEASPVAVAPGADVAQVEIRIRKARTFRVRGKAIDARSGAAAAGAKVEIEGQGSVETHADGTFDARAIPPGRHRVSASLTRNGLGLASVWQEVTVADRDAEGLVLRLEPLVSLAGTVAVEGVGAGKPSSARVTLEPLGGLGEMERAQAGEDGRFTVARLVPQAYRLTVDNMAAGLYLKSARLSEQDVAESGRIDVAAGVGSLALVLAGDSGSVTGTVKTAGPGEWPVVVTIAPAGRLAGRSDLVNTVDLAEGRFAIKRVAPGDYRVWAWELQNEQIAESPEFRKLLESRATLVTVHPGETQTVALATITAAEAAEAREKLR